MKKMTPAVVRIVRGMLRRKIQRHDSADLEERAPPITGPMPLAMATTAPYKGASVSKSDYINGDGYISYQNSLVLAALPQRHDIADNELGDSHEASSSDTGQGTEDGELQHRLGERRGERTKEEDGQTGEENDLAGPNVGEAAVDELANSGRAVDVSLGRILIDRELRYVGNQHEVTACYPRDLRHGTQRLADNVETRCEGGLVHEGEEVDACAGQEDLQATQVSILRCGPGYIKQCRRRIGTAKKKFT